jgi:hypothetical protein
LNSGNMRSREIPVLQFLTGSPSLPRPDVNRVVRPARIS